MEVSTFKNWLRYIRERALQGLTFPAGTDIFFSAPPQRKMHLRKVQRATELASPRADARQERGRALLDGGGAALEARAAGPSVRAAFLGQ